MTRHIRTAGLVAFLAAGWASADVKITANYNNDGKASETTIYANGTRLRYEYGKGLVLLRQCDLSRIVQIDDKARTYMVMPADLPTGGTAAEPAAPAGNVEVTDTNEHKDMFGYPARHLKITESKEGKPERTETDGWYIDLKDMNSCSRPQTSPQGGYPISYTVTTYGEGSKASSTVSMRVTALVTAPLDAALFEIPHGYAESTPQAAALKVPPKAAGSIRIGTVPLATQSLQNVQGGAAYNQLVGQLQAAQFEVLPLPAGTSEGIQQKARENDCDYVLYTELSALDKPAAGKVGGFLHKAPGLSRMTGGDAMEAQVAYRLVPAGGGSPVIASSITGKTGSSFDWKSAALLASNVLPMTMAVRMLGGAFNPAMMTAIMSGRGPGAALTSIDPMMGSLTMFLRATNGSSGLLGGAARNPPGADAAIGAALDQVGKAVIAQLKR
jgi:hypothetical protein